MTDKLNLAVVRAELACIGVTIKSQDGQYRVNFRAGGSEDTAYYTDDLEDARGAGYGMVERRGSLVG